MNSLSHVLLFSSEKINHCRSFQHPHIIWNTPRVRGDKAGDDLTLYSTCDLSLSLPPGHVAGQIPRYIGGGGEVQIIGPTLEALECCRGTVMETDVRAAVRDIDVGEASSGQNDPAWRPSLAALLVCLRGLRSFYMTLFSQIVVTGVSWSASTTSRPLFLKAPWFQKVCSADAEAQRRHRAMLTAHRRWMQEEDDSSTPNILNVFLFCYKGVFVRTYDT